MIADLTCTDVGRFADPTDTTCQGYVLCVYDPSSSTYSGYSYKCPDTSVFNANTTFCTKPENYECTITNSPCKEEGFIPDPDSSDCTSYLLCYSDSKGVIYDEKLECPNSYFNPNLGYCVVNYRCPRLFTCRAPGYFADPSDRSCRKFFLCVSQDRTYLQYTYECPSTSKFDPDREVCTSSYQCSNWNYYKTDNNEFPLISMDFQNNI